MSNEQVIADLRAFQSILYYGGELGGDEVPLLDLAVDILASRPSVQPAWQTPRFEPHEGGTGLAVFHKTNRVPERTFMLDSRESFDLLVEYIALHRAEAAGCLK